VERCARRLVVAVLDGDIDHPRVTGGYRDLRACRVDGNGVLWAHECLAEPNTEVRAEPGPSDEGVLSSRERPVRRIDVSNGVRSRGGQGRIVNAARNRSVDEVHTAHASIVRTWTDTENAFALCEATAQMDAEHRCNCVTTPGHDNRV
jgi:hypothetical protein